MTIAIEREQLGLHVAGDDIGAGDVGDRRRQRGPAQQVGGQVLRSGVPVILGLDLVQAGPEGRCLPRAGQRQPGHDCDPDRVVRAGGAGDLNAPGAADPAGQLAQRVRVADLLESGWGSQRPS